MPDSMKNRAYEGLLQAYLQVCNQVLEENRDRFPYSQIWQAGEEALAGRTIRFAVFDDEPKAQCKVTLEHKKITPDENLVRNDAPTMRLSARYLEDVVSNPDKYIENPSLIDWNWLRPGK